MGKTYKILGENTFTCTWKLCSEEVPPVPNVEEPLKEYLVLSATGYCGVLRWCDGWNCHFNSKDEIDRKSEILDIVAWMPIPKLSVEIVIST